MTTLKRLVSNIAITLNYKKELYIIPIIRFNHLIIVEKTC